MNLIWPDSQENPMRLLVVADLHYSLPQYDWVMSVASDYDVVIIAGDHLDLSSMVDPNAQIVVVGKYLARLREKTRLITCSGNHDLDARSADGEKISRWIREVPGVVTDGQSFAIGDTFFSVCAWWDGPIERDAIGAQFRADAAQPKSKWIWVYHAPPGQSPTSWGGSRSYGDAELGKWIDEYKPDIVFAGHVHQAPFIKEGSWVDRVGSTWVFNAGHQYGAPPAHLIVDTDAGEALWFSAAGREWVKLDEPLVRPVEKLRATPDWLTPADRPTGPAPA
jgi:Icc-related predicted phosphoesterase